MPTTTIQVWLHEARDEAGEAGYNAWGLVHPGFSCWAETESQALEKTPSKLAEYWQLRQRHGLSSPSTACVEDVQVEVVERVAGNEILFSSDYQPATCSLIDETVALLDATRSDLLEAIRGLPDRVLDWNPPYRRFRSWARWRTVRQILTHIANTETHYYLPNIGLRTEIAPAREEGNWDDQLVIHRERTLETLNALQASHDLARVQFHDEGAWSVGKVLRRLVWHERLHTKSIQRIGRAYCSQ